MLTCRINPPLLLKPCYTCCKTRFVDHVGSSRLEELSLWIFVVKSCRLAQTLIFNRFLQLICSKKWCFMQFQCLRSTSGTMQRNWKQTMMELQNAPCTAARSPPSWKPKPWGSGAQWVTCGWCGWWGCPEILLNWMLDIPSCSVWL